MNIVDVGNAIYDKLLAVSTKITTDNLHFEFIPKGSKKPAISYSIIYNSDNVKYDSNTSEKSLLLTVNVLTENKRSKQFTNLSLINAIREDFQVFTGVIGDITIISSEANDTVIGVDEETNNLLSSISFNINYYISE